MAGTGTLYRTLWRWHFYAGLLVIPLVLVLSLTGAAYLFKPQVDRWEERAFRDLPTAALAADHEASPAHQRTAALAAFPGARFHSYRLPETAGDAALVHLVLPGGAMRDVFVAPDGRVLGALDPQWRIMQVLHDLHGQLLAGRPGSWLVELAGSWAIVLVVTGLYLWWPRDNGQGRGMAGTLWPRLRSGRAVLWRDLHAVGGVWVSLLALVLLVTALPWTSVWGSAFKAIRTELAGHPVRQDWTIGGRAPDAGEHAAHDHGAMAGMAGMPGMAGTPVMDHAAADDALLNAVVARARSERLAFPAIVTPPARPCAPWTAKSDAQNRPLRATVTYDGGTGQRLAREDFADKPLADRVIGYGVAWHEGQLLGWFNQLVGLLTAALLVLVAVTGFARWRRRKPAGTLGAPALPAGGSARAGWIILLVAAAALPLLAASLAVIALAEWLVLPRLPRAARWLGLTPPGPI